MIYDVQKAGLWKRISAYLFDVILLAIVAVGCAALLSAAVQYDVHIAHRKELQKNFENRYGVSFEISKQDYEALDPTAKKQFDDAYLAFAKDAEVTRTDALLTNLAMIITAFGILAAYVILEFAIPLRLGNGQTLGKKIFGIALMRADGVRMGSLQLFIRTVLGKYTLETMLPLLLLLMWALGVLPLFGILGLGVLLVTQIILLLAKPLRTPIHDMIAATVAVDLSSQLIFDSPEELMEYKKRIHAKEAENAEYP